ncbi:MAG: RNHCP domain-containing protein [Candidatus Micrarchaeaceae archaeon]
MEHAGYDSALGLTPSRRFSRTIEDFTCEHCGKHMHGNGYTDHCSSCLWSKHVDINPGDRASGCGGMMKPIGAEYIHGQYKIHFKCQKCGEEKAVKALPEDNKELLIELTIRNRARSRNR